MFSDTNDARIRQTRIISFSTSDIFFAYIFTASEYIFVRSWPNGVDLENLANLKVFDGKNLVKKLFWF